MALLWKWTFAFVVVVVTFNEIIRTVCSIVFVGKINDNLFLRRYFSGKVFHVALMSFTFEIVLLFVSFVGNPYLTDFEHTLMSLSIILGVAFSNLIPTMNVLIPKCATAVNRKMTFDRSVTAFASCDSQKNLLSEIYPILILN